MPLFRYQSDNSESQEEVQESSSLISEEEKEEEDYDESEKNDDDEEEDDEEFVDPEYKKFILQKQQPLATKKHKIEKSHPHDKEQPLLVIDQQKFSGKLLYQLSNFKWVTRDQLPPSAICDSDLLPEATPLRKTRSTSQRAPARKFDPSTETALQRKTPTIRDSIPKKSPVDTKKGQAPPEKPLIDLDSSDSDSFGGLALYFDPDENNKTSITEEAAHAPKKRGRKKRINTERVSEETTKEKSHAKRGRKPKHKDKEDKESLSKEKAINNKTKKSEKAKRENNHKKQSESLSEDKRRRKKDGEKGETDSERKGNDESKKKNRQKKEKDDKSTDSTGIENYSDSSSFDSDDEFGRLLNKSDFFLGTKPKHSTADKTRLYWDTKQKENSPLPTTRNALSTETDLRKREQLTSQATLENETKAPSLSQSMDSTSHQLSTSQINDSTSQINDSTAQNKSSTSQINDSTSQNKSSTSQINDSTSQNKSSTSQSKFSPLQNKFSTSQSKFSPSQNKFSTSQSKKHKKEQKKKKEKKKKKEGKPDAKASHPNHPELNLISPETNKITHVPVSPSIWPERFEISGSDTSPTIDRFFREEMQMPNDSQRAAESGGFVIQVNSDEE